jgi:6-phosphogluconolactonase
MTSPAAAMKVEVLADPDALARRAAEWIVGIAKETQGVIAIALSGGSTPQRLYQGLVLPPYRDAIPWSRTHWFWGDERFVPHDDAQSNYRMVRDALLSHVPIPGANVHAVQFEGLTPEMSALAYERKLKAFYGAERLDPARPLFDITLLGLGADGHTASLFPGTAVLSDREHWAAALIGAKAEPRITLTYPVLESSRHTAFLVEGAEKRAIFSRLRLGDQTLPAAHLAPSGEFCAFADLAAAGDDW